MGNNKGAIAITFAILLAVLLGTVGIGVEVGKWYLIKAEITKAADAAALMGARSISNLNLTEAEKITLMNDLAKQNFSPGYLGTPGEGESGCVSFTPTIIANIKARVAGTVSTGTIFAKLFGVDRVSSGKTSVAGSDLNIEIFLVRDLTGCGFMCEDAWIQGCNKIVEAFSDHQSTVKIGYIAYNRVAVIAYPLQHNFLTESATNPYTGSTYANIYEAIADHTALPTNDTTVCDIVFDLAREGGVVNGVNMYGFTSEVNKKFIIFMKGYGVNGLADDFTRNSIEYYGAACFDYGGFPPIWHPYTYESIIASRPIGDGTGETTKYHIFEKWKDDPYIPNALEIYNAFVGSPSTFWDRIRTGDLRIQWRDYINGTNWFYDTTNKRMGVMHAEAIEAANRLKNFNGVVDNVKIFSVDGGCPNGENILDENQLYMKTIASNPKEKYFYMRTTGATWPPNDESCEILVDYYEEIIDVIITESIDPQKIRLLK